MVNPSSSDYVVVVVDFVHVFDSFTFYAFSETVLQFNIIASFSLATYKITFNIHNVVFCSSFIHPPPGLSIFKYKLLLLPFPDAHLQKRRKKKWRLNYKIIISALV